MTGPFEGKRIVLGVSGSIAAYKAADLASKLTQAGALVDVLLTQAATQFVSPLSFRSLTHRAVVTDMFDVDSPDAVEHVTLAKAADVLVVAPATANTLAKLAHGMADDPVSLTALATGAPVLVAPAMDAGMWEHPAVQANARTLQERGVTIIGPAHGRMASGLEGYGRLVEVPELLGRIAQALGRNGNLAGLTVVVTAGGTQEPIDAVRVVTNRSSGRMGYAIAEAARDRGAHAVLVAASTALPDPPGVECVHVRTAEEMRSAVLAACRSAHALVMAAAVADYRPAAPNARKLKKEDSAILQVPLERTADILMDARRDIVRVGFAAESDDLLRNARVKLEAKALDLIAANDITQSDAGFDVETNRVTLVSKDGAEELPLLSKYDVAARIMDRVAALLAAKGVTAVR